MSVITRQIGPCFAAEVDGIDMTKPLSADEVDAIHAGMDRYAVLVFHDQESTTSSSSPSPQPGRHRARHRHQPARAGRLSAADHVCRRVQPRQGQQVFARDDRRAALRAGQPALALRQLVQGDPGEVLAAAARNPVEGRQHRVRLHAGGLRRARRRDEGRGRGAHLRALAALLAAQLGFTDFTEEERERFKPVRQCLVRTHPVRSAGRSTCPRTPAASRLAGAGGARLPA